MELPKPEPYFTHRQERQLLRAVAEEIQSEFPNLERRGCPAADAIHQLARRRISLIEADDLVDHIVSCAPCFDTYKRYRSRRFARVGGLTLSALVILILIGMAVLWHNRTTHGNRPNQQTAHVPAPPIFNASIDYREIAPTRSPDVQVSPARTPRLQRALLNLTILMPFGSEDGEYAIEIRGLAGDPMVATSGVAKWTGVAEVLSVRLDLLSLAAGEYTLALRRSGASWHSYPLILEEGK